MEVFNITILQYLVSLTVHVRMIQKLFSNIPYYTILENFKKSYEIEQNKKSNIVIFGEEVQKLSDGQTENYRAN